MHLLLPLLLSEESLSKFIEPYTIFLMFKSLPTSGKIALAFCGGVAAVLLVQNDTAPYRAQLAAEEEQKAEQQEEKKTERRQRTRKRSTEKVESAAPAVPQKPAGWECDVSSDCPGYSTICNDRNKCEQLKDVVCTCSQPDVVQCADTSERARHTFCAKGCVQVLDENKKATGATCRE